MTSEKQRDANQKVFEKGQQDFRDGVFSNPYPSQSEYYQIWEQGYESERDIHNK